MEEDDADEDERRTIGGSPPPRAFNGDTGILGEEQEGEEEGVEPVRRGLRMGVRGPELRLGCGGRV